MTDARARAEYDFWSHGVKVAISPYPNVYMRFKEVFCHQEDPGSVPVQHSDVWLNLTTDAAMALYEALGRYFHDETPGAVSKYLEKRLDVEQSRVDRMLDSLISKNDRS